eukprot:scaffold33322_cov61-Phaeocystis_antarctica.AAC.1
MDMDMDMDMATYTLSHRAERSPNIRSLDSSCYRVSCRPLHGSLHVLKLRRGRLAAWLSESEVEARPGRGRVWCTVRLCGRTPAERCRRYCGAARHHRKHPHKRGAALESNAAGCCPANAQQPASRGGCCPAAGQQPPRSPRSNRPPEAGAALRSRGIRPPELQEPLPRKAGAVRGSPTAPAVAAPGTVAGAARDR